MSKVHVYGEDKSIRFQVSTKIGRFGTQLVRKSTNQLLPSTIEVFPALHRFSNRIVRLRYHKKGVLPSFEELDRRAQDKRTRKHVYLFINPVLVVVGNKIDKAEEETISYQDAKQYADSMGAMLKLTSAKDGKGINVQLHPIRNSLLQ